VIEYLMVFPERADAEHAAEELGDDEFTSVRVVSEALAGEDDAEDVDWVVHVVQDTIDDPSSAVARALAERFTVLAQEHGGWLDDSHSDGD